MPTFLTSMDTAALARRLNSPDAQERLQAQADLQALIALDVRRIQNIRRMELASPFVYALINFSLLLGYIFTSKSVINLYAIACSFALFMVLSLLASCKNRIARTIVTLDMPQAVGPLIEVYARSKFSFSSDLKLGLIRLLPRLQPGDANLLTARQRKMLYGLLSNARYAMCDAQGADATLTIAILRALEQIGDEEALPRVEKLACSERNPQVCAAAQECLPFLMLRVEQNRVEQTLLRAGMPPTSPETLLRPIVTNAPMAPQQLLRASTTDSDTHTL